jgi:hypothetical protein
MEKTTEQRIECKSGHLLARAHIDGIKLWCGKHRREELITWEQLNALRTSFAALHDTVVSTGN